MKITPRNNNETEKEEVYRPKFSVKARFKFEFDKATKIDLKQCFLVLDKVERTLDLPPLLASRNLDLSNRQTAQEKLSAAKEYGAIWAIRNSYESYWDALSTDGNYQQLLFNQGEYKPQLTIVVESDGKKEYFHAVLPKALETISISDQPLDLGEVLIKNLEPIEQE